MPLRSRDIFLPCQRRSDVGDQPVRRDARSAHGRDGSRYRRLRHSGAARRLIDALLGSETSFACSFAKRVPSGSYFLMDAARLPEMRTSGTTPMLLPITDVCGVDA